MTCIYSWNVNGLRAALKNGFLEWLQETRPDVLCLQETRLMPDEAPQELFSSLGYQMYWNPAVKRGYSGTATFTRIVPEKTTTLQTAEFDEEGRAQFVYFKDYVLVNTYWPNSQEERKRLAYKLAFCSSIGTALDGLVKARKNIIICGDFNIAHREIDLARPKQNENNAGYYVEERDAMTAFLERGYRDVFRSLYPDRVAYTWWSYRGRARANNIGWRLDYFCVNNKFLSRIEDIQICDTVSGSDHCPVALTLSKSSEVQRKTR